MLTGSGAQINFVSRCQTVIAGKEAEIVLQYAYDLGGSFDVHSLSASLTPGKQYVYAARWPGAIGGRDFTILDRGQRSEDGEADAERLLDGEVPRRRTGRCDSRRWGACPTPRLDRRSLRHCGTLTNRLARMVAPAARLCRPLTRSRLSSQSLCAPSA